jgi:hypothetical protein
MKAALLPALLAANTCVGALLRAGPDAPVEWVSVAVGLDYARLNLGEPEDRLLAHVLRFSLREKSLRVRTLKAEGKETLRGMVERLNQKGERVLGAVNGDFFHLDSKAGVPFGVQVADGELLFGPRRRSMIGFSADNRPTIGIVALEAQLVIAGAGSTPKPLKVDGVNVFPGEFRQRNGVLLYTPAFQELDASSALALVLAIEKLEPALQVGDRCVGRLARVEDGGQKLEVPAGGCLICVLGDQAKAWRGRLRPGLPVEIRVALPPIKGGVPHAIGGGPRLVRDGKPGVEIDKEDFERTHAIQINRPRHPRSAVGYDRERRTLILATVEGRTERSRGMSLAELAAFLKRLGCHDAMGFDGGGSAAMYVLGQGIVTQPSAEEKAESRQIANSLLITAPSPEKGAGKPSPPASSGNGRPNG